MSDYTDELLNRKLQAEEAHEALCPKCEICSNRILDGDYFFDIDGTYVCDEATCVYKFLEPFKRSVLNYVQGGC